MGTGTGFKCKKCGCENFVLTGIGFLFPTEYEELMNDIGAGKYGDDMKQALCDNADAVDDAEKHLYTCECGYWDTMPGCDIYIPKRKVKKIPSYVTYSKIEEEYSLLKSYTHICPECGKKMTKADEEETEQLRCRSCGELCSVNSESDFRICWD